MYRPTIGTGVGGGAGWQALAWALEEAAVTDGRLEICHVCPAESPLVTRAAAVPIGLLELADPPLARAVAAAKTRLGGNRVTLTIHTGRVDQALVRTSAHTDLMVIAGSGRTTHQVATHADCPVVVVRPDTSARRGPFAGHVVAGVDGSPPSRTALAFGFAYAAAHRLPLAAVHVTPHDGNDFWVDDQMLETHFTIEPTALAMLSAETEPWTREYPTVAVKRAVCGDRPPAGLMRAAAGARLLVVGDRGRVACRSGHMPAFVSRGPIARAVLGSVADGVIDHASCTVAVTHAQDTPVAMPTHHLVGGRM